MDRPALQELRRKCVEDMAKAEQMMIDDPTSQFWANDHAFNQGMIRSIDRLLKEVVE